MYTTETAQLSQHTSRHSAPCPKVVSPPSNTGSFVSSTFISATAQTNQPSPIMHRFQLSATTPRTVRSTAPHDGTSSPPARHPSPVLPLRLGICSPLLWQDRKNKKVNTSHQFTTTNAPVSRESRTSPAAWKATPPLDYTSLRRSSQSLAAPPSETKAWGHRQPLLEQPQPLSTLLRFRQVTPYYGYGFRPYK